MLEHSPLIRIVMEPFPQLGTRRDIFQPQIDSRVFLLQTSRPESIHENTNAVALVRLQIDPLDPDFQSVLPGFLEGGTLRSNYFH